MSEIRVLVVADDLGLAGDLMLSLERQRAVRILGPVRDALAALDPIGSGAVDVVIVDLDRSDEDAFLILAHLRECEPKAKILGVASDMRADVAAVALASGANGLMSRGAPPARMLDAIVCVMSGGFVLPGPGRAGGAPLTPRELEVAALLAVGRSTSEIAEELGISAATVKSHVKSVYVKLEAHSQMEAVREAWRTGLVPLPVGA